MYTLDTFPKNEHVGKAMPDGSVKSFECSEDPTTYLFIDIYGRGFSRDTKNVAVAYPANVIVDMVNKGCWKLLRDAKKTDKQIYLHNKNTVHNTCGAQRSEIKTIVRECIQEMVRDEIRRYMQTTAFGYTVKKAIEPGILSDAIAKVVKEQFTLTIKERE